ncbi:unnamed protein product [Adineta ricciae]|uniref:Uncharacterized protein n=1 Tax=Adineta ricciae TaxID=249248 RepID=A0A814EZI9_ADIRI|nr:unnamed protein product [Adineta ricciae]
MSKNPEIYKKIKTGLVDYDGQQLATLVYLDCVLGELLRLLGPILGSLRTLTADNRLPGAGAQLRKSDSLMVSFYTLTRDRRYWSDLNDPEHRNNLAPSMENDLARFEMNVTCARLMQSVTFGDGLHQY